MIPKQIYRTWVNQDLPSPFRSAWIYTKNHNPLFVQTLYTDHDMEMFMRRKYLNHSIWGDLVYEAFSSISPIYGTVRADLFRYALLYEQGGIYLDAKSAARNISKIMNSDDKFITSRWPIYSIVRLWSSIHLKSFQGEYQQFWIASSAKHPILKRVIDLTIQNLRLYTDHSDDIKSCSQMKTFFGEKSLILYLVPSCKGVDVLWTTGPFVFTKAVDYHRLTEKKDFRILYPDGDSTFIYDLKGNHRKYTRGYWTSGEALKRFPTTNRHSILETKFGRERFSDLIKQRNNTG